MAGGLVIAAHVPSLPTAAAAGPTPVTLSAAASASHSTASLTLAIGTNPRIGFNNIADRDFINSGTIKNQCKAAGIFWDRVEANSGSDMAAADRCIADGLIPLIVYNPSFTGTTQAQDITNCTGIATAMQARGLTLLEFYNEPWFNGAPQPQPYATRYAAVLSALAGTGIVLIAQVTGDYQRLDGTWSNTLAGGGWIRDFQAQIPGTTVAGWSAHPYSPGSNIVVENAEHAGWPAMAQYKSITDSLGSTAPWFVTEMGIQYSDVGGKAQQATMYTRLLNSLSSADAGIPGTPYNWIEVLLFYSTTDDTTGTWGIFENPNELSGGDPGGEARPALTSIATWISAHP